MNDYSYVRLLVHFIYLYSMHEPGTCGKINTSAVLHDSCGLLTATNTMSLVQQSIYKLGARSCPFLQSAQPVHDRHFDAFLSWLGKPLNDT